MSCKEAHHTDHTVAQYFKATIETFTVNPKPDFFIFILLLAFSVSQHQLPAPLSVFTAAARQMKTKILRPKNTSDFSTTAAAGLAVHVHKPAEIVRQSQEMFEGFKQVSV